MDLALKEHWASTEKWDTIIIRWQECCCITEQIKLMWSQLNTVSLTCRLDIQTLELLSGFGNAQTPTWESW